LHQEKHLHLLEDEKGISGNYRIREVVGDFIEPKIEGTTGTAPPAIPRSASTETMETSETTESVGREVIDKELGNVVRKAVDEVFNGAVGDFMKFEINQLQKDNTPQATPPATPRSVVGSGEAVLNAEGSDAAVVGTVASPRGARVVRVTRVREVVMQLGLGMRLR